MSGAKALRQERVGLRKEHLGDCGAGGELEERKSAQGSPVDPRNARLCPERDASLRGLLVEE